MSPVHPHINLLHPFQKLVTLRQDAENPTLDSMHDSMSGLTTPVIIGISVGSALLLILLVSLAVYCYCRSPSRANASDTLYYKFDYNSSSLATLEKHAQTIKNNTHTSSTSDASSRPPSSLYLTDDFSIPFDSQYSNKHNSSSKKNRNRSGKTNSSYASMDDGISAPRTLESEVPSSKVAFLDEHGRPITTPL